MWFSRPRRPGRSPSATSSPTSRALSTPAPRSRAFSWAGPAVFDRPAAGADPEPRALPGVLRPGRLASVESRHGERGSALHAELPVDRGKQPGGRLQPRDPPTGLPGTEWPTARGPSAAQAQLRSAPRHRRAGDRPDGRPDRLCAGLDRAGRDHDALHDAGLSVSADGLPAHARQHRSGIHPRGRTPSRADCPHAGCRPRPGRLCRRPRSRIGLRAAVECVPSARAHGEHLDGGRVRRLEDYPRWHSGHQRQSAHGRTARAGVVAPAAGAEPVLWHDPALLVARRSDDPDRPAAQTVSAIHDGQPLPQQCRHDALQRFLRQAGAAFVARPVVSRELHAVEAGGRCLVGLRRVDPDRTDRQLPGRRQLQSTARARLLDW